MIQKKIFLVLFFIASINLYCQTAEESKITFKMIFDSLKGIKGNKPITIRDKQKYDAFDFKLFKPVGNYSGGSDYFEVSYNDQQAIVRIEHIEKKGKMENFIFNVFDFSSFAIWSFSNNYENFTVSERYNLYTQSFFIRIKSSQKNYFVNPLPQFGVKTEVGGIYGEPFDVKDISGISCIMTLRDDLWPETIFRFRDGKFIFGSHIIYKDDKRTTIGENIFINTENDKILIEEKTNLNSKFFERITYTYPFSFFAKPRIKEDYLIFPLWNWLGIHQYSFMNSKKYLR